jgi:hypothetical protein
LSRDPVQVSDKRLQERAAMTLQKPLVEEERWSPVEALIWIATRSRRFVDALKGLPMYVAEDRLWRLRRETFAPYAVSLPDALSAFREQAQRAGVPGLEEFSRRDDGSVRGLNIFEFALMDISILAADAIRVWPDWQAILAWNAAKTRPWRRPKGFSRAWIRSLPRTEYLPFADVADVLAFGPARAAIGLSEIEEHAARLSAGVAIVSAAVRGEVKLVGAPCERLKEHPHLVRQTGRLLAIDSDALHDLIPVPYGGRDWLSRVGMRMNMQTATRRKSVSFAKRWLSGSF